MSWNQVVGPDGQPASPGKVEVNFSSRVHMLAYPVMAEVYVRRLLDRDELRAICDRHWTREAIRAALEDA
jgi:hypothetical protein